MHILHIDASATKGAASHSRRLSAELVSALKTRHADATIVYRDLAVDRLPHVDTTIRQAWTPEGQQDEALQDVGSRSRALVEEIKDADVLVIGSPMYNFTVPSTLKAWIDHIAIAGQTFRYTENGPKGLLDGKRAYLALSSGGIYSQGPGQAREHLASYLTSIMSFVGITEVRVVRAEGIALGPNKEEEAMKAALESISELI